MWPLNGIPKNGITKRSGIANKDMCTQTIYVNTIDIQTTKPKERMSFDRVELSVSKLNVFVSRSLPTSYHKLMVAKDHTGKINEPNQV